MNYKSHLCSQTLSKNNSFKQNDTISEILRKEKDLYEYGKKKIQSKIYYPGFFIVGGIKK